MNTISETDSISIDLSATSRRCGSCQLCCRLLPVLALSKGANTRCAYQRTGKGCTVYRTRQMPAECHVWSCRWLVDPATASLHRPDRSHYVIDVMPDMIGIDENGVTRDCMVVQVWVDPNFPNAHRDPALRRYLEALAETDRMPALVRCGSVGLVLIAPSLNTSGEWQEIRSQVRGGYTNRFVEKLAGR